MSFMIRLFAVLAAFLLFISQGHAAFFTVDSGSDLTDQSPGDGVCRTVSQNCTLRAAIQETNATVGADTITLSPAVSSFALSLLGGMIDENNSAEGDLDITDSLTITGSGANQQTIQVNMFSSINEFRVFHIGPNNNFNLNVTISGVTIHNGLSTKGAGLYLESGSLTLDGVMISDNHASIPTQGVVGGGDGGGIYARNGRLVIKNSAISDNTAFSGSGIFIESSMQQTDIVNSTISGNSKATFTSGGGIYNASSTLRIANSTITNNQNSGGCSLVPSGAGIATVGTTRIKNSIVAKNVRTNECGSTTPTAMDCSGSLISEGYNLIGNSGGCSISQSTGDQLSNIDPLLGPLSNNGGGTPTHALLTSSPAIDQGNPAGCTDFNGLPLTQDQRGFVRPATSSVSLPGRCDIGAFELGSGGSGTANTLTAFAMTLQAYNSQTISGALGASDPENRGNLTFVINQNPAKGTMQLANNGNGFFYYTPFPGQVGADSFTYSVRSTTGTQSQPATVNINILSGNPTLSAPVSTPITISAMPGATNRGTLPVYDINGDTPQFTAINNQATQKGIVSIVPGLTQRGSPDGTATFRYTANVGQTGADSFQYTVSDGVNTTTGMVSVTIGGSTGGIVSTTNVSQNFVSRTAVTQGSLVSGVIAPQGATITYNRSTNPLYGSINLNSSTGSFTYTPNTTVPATVVSDSFQFTVNYTLPGGQLGNAGPSTVTLNFDGGTSTLVTASNSFEQNISRTQLTTRLLNITAPTGTPLTITRSTNPLYGNVTFDNNNRSFTYTPTGTVPATATSDSFQFTVSYTLPGGQTGITPAATVTLSFEGGTGTQVTAINSFEQNVSRTIPTARVLNIAAPTGTTLTITRTTAALYGNVVIDNNSRTFTYTPTATVPATVTSDSFQFTVNYTLPSGQTGATQAATVTLNFDTAPVITVVANSAVFYNVPRNTTFNTGSLDNFVTKPTGTTLALTYNVTVQPINGQLNLNASSGTFTYTPNASAATASSDSFTYTVTYTNNGVPVTTPAAAVTLNYTSTTATTVTANPAVYYNVPRTTAPVFTGTLDNFVTKPVGTALTMTYSITTQPTSGLVTLTTPSTGAFSYAPNGTSSSTAQSDTFQYSISYSINGAQTLIAGPAAVTLNFTAAVNPRTVTTVPETIPNVSRTIPFTESLAPHVNNPSGATLTYLVTSPPVAGRAEFTNQSTGSITYTPNGTTSLTAPSDSFQFSVSYNNGSQVVNTPPVLVTLSFVGSSNPTTVTVNPASFSNVPRTTAFSNSVDTSVLRPSNTVLTYSVSNSGITTYGSVSITPTTGAFTYTPNNTTSATAQSDTFQYSVSYLLNGVATIAGPAAVTLNFTGASNPTTVTAGPATFPNVSRTTAYSGSLDSFVIKPAGTALTYAIASTTTTYGTVILSNASTGAFTYTPNAASAATPFSDSFQYSVSSNIGNSGPVTATLTFANATVNKPRGNPQTLSTAKNTALNITLSGVNAAGSATGITYELVQNTSTSGGILALTNAQTGQVTYTPAAGYVGTDSFSYRVKEGTGSVSDNAIISITVTDSGSGGGKSSKKGSVGPAMLFAMFGLMLWFRRRNMTVA